MKKENEGLKPEEKELLEAIKLEVADQIEKGNANNVDKGALESLKTQVDACATSAQMKDLTQNLSDLKAEMGKTSEKAAKEEVKTLKSLIEEHSEVLKNIKKNKSVSSKGVVIDVQNKATHVASDIGGRDYLGEVEAGIGRKPVRRTSILDLFAVDTVSAEYLHYWEEDTITRDAKFVIACATSTHTTAKNWKKTTIELAKIRDITEVCIDMLDDYDFVESELLALVNESIQLKKESELLTGASAAATDLLSIDFISSEFAPANVLAPFDGLTGKGFQSANFEQLVSAMKAQISVFGQENAWMPNTVVMNFTDYTRYKHLKDLDNNKLFHTVSDGFTTIDGMRVVTSPLVAANTCYVFDSTQGRIKQRKGYTATISYENNDNIEHELATIVAHERLQFHVRLINRDAFMKCSDITAAITAITNP
jgi:HK97 family phage major capsid protein